jgi:hypothetical protein
MHRRSVQWIVPFCLMCVGSLTATWSPPVDLTQVGQDVGRPEIATDPHGNVIAVWYRASGKDYVLQSYTKPLGGSWQLSGNLSSIRYLEDNPPVAIGADANGNVAGVWWRVKKTKGVIQATSKPFGGTWQETSVDLSRPAPDAENVQVVLDNSGNATAVWGDFNGKNWATRCSTKPFGQGWQEGLCTLSHAAGKPRIAIDAHGNITAVWEKHDKDHTFIQSSTKSKDGAWQSVSNCLSHTTQNSYLPQIAVNAAGYAVVVWKTYDNSNHLIIQASVRPFGGSWQSTSEAISQSGQDADLPKIAVDTQGNATAVWKKSNGDSWTIQASTKPCEGTWQEIPDNLSLPGQNADRPQIFIAANGSALAVWKAYDGKNWVIQSSTRPSGGTWQETPETLSQLADEEDVKIAIDPIGHVTAVWCRKDGNGPVIQSSTNYLYPTETSPLPPSAPPLITDPKPSTSTNSVGSTPVPPPSAPRQTIEPAPIAKPVPGTSTNSVGSTPVPPPSAPRQTIEPAPIAKPVPSTSTNSVGSTSVSSEPPSAPGHIEETAPPLTTVGRTRTYIVDRIVADPSRTTFTHRPATRRSATRRPTHRHTRRSTSPLGFSGAGRLSKKGLSLKTRWKKNTNSNIVRYEIFARNKRIGKISANERSRTTLRLHPRHRPRRLSKNYRLFLHNKYRIRTIDATGNASAFTKIDVRTVKLSKPSARGRLYTWQPPQNVETEDQ